MNIIWSPLALDRVSEIAGYIAQDKPSAAEKWVKAIFSKVEQLEVSPELGRIVPGLNRDTPYLFGRSVQLSFVSFRSCQESHE